MGSKKFQFGQKKNVQSGQQKVPHCQHTTPNESRDDTHAENHANKRILPVLKTRAACATRRKTSFTNSSERSNSVTMSALLTEMWRRMTRDTKHNDTEFAEAGAEQNGNSNTL